jgi:hypothetical protein
MPPPEMLPALVTVALPADRTRTPLMVPEIVAPALFETLPPAASRMASVPPAILAELVIMPAPAR